MADNSGPFKDLQSQACLGIKIYHVQNIYSEEVSFLSTNVSSNTEDLSAGSDNVSDQIIEIIPEEVLPYNNFLKRRNCKKISTAFSKFKFLKGISHENLTKYVDIKPCKFREDALVVYSEHFSISLEEIAALRKNEQVKFTEEEFRVISYETLQAIEFLNKKLFFELLAIKPYQIVFDCQGYIKICDYGHYALTSFTQEKIGTLSSTEIKFIPPEFFLTYASVTPDKISFGYKGEIWTLGIILLSCLSVEIKDDPFTSVTSPLQLIKELINLSFKYRDGPIFQKFPYNIESDSALETYLCGCNIEGISYECRDFLSKCLELNPNRRLSAFDLVRHPFFNKLKSNSCPYAPSVLIRASPKADPERRPFLLRRMLLDSNYSAEDYSDSDIVELFSLETVTLFLKTLQPNLEENLVRLGYINKPSPVNNLPLLITNTSSSPFSSRNTLQQILDIPLKNTILLLKKELAFFKLKANSIHREAEVAQTSLLDRKEEQEKSFFKQANKLNLNSAAASLDGLGSRLFKRINISDKLSNIFGRKAKNAESESDKISNNSSSEKSTTVELKTQATVPALPSGQMPFSSGLIINTQIFLIYSSALQLKSFNLLPFLYRLPLPDTLRKEIWRKLLNIQYDCSDVYELLALDNQIYNKGSPCLLQIELDIPRCHQYNPYLNSYYGKLKLYRVLSGVLNLDSKLTYMQGFDAMAATVLEATGYEEELSCIMLFEVFKKFGKVASEGDDMSMIKEQLVIFRWLLTFVEPLLGTHLKMIGFLPELYAVSWFLNLFSMVFSIDKTMKIWDLILCEPNLVIIFAVAIMCDLKDRLAMMNLNECISCIRNLEGVIELERCLYFAGALSEMIPSSLFVLNVKKEKCKDSSEDYDNEFYQARPWEIPLDISSLEHRRVFYVTIFDLMSLNKISPIIIDIRSTNEFEDFHVMNSLHMPLSSDNKLNEVYIDYLELKTRSAFSIDSPKEIYSFNDKILFSKENSNFSLVVIVGNYGNSVAEGCASVLVERGIRFVSVLNGGVQSAKLDAPELLKIKGKSTPLAFYKKELKNTSNNV